MNLLKIREQLNLGIPLSQINLRVTNYSRVSTDHLEQQSSLKNQQDYFKEMIKNNLYWTHIQGYVDEGISGTTDYKRTNFMKMIEDAKLGKFDLIITKEISRFSRNTLDSIKYTRELLSYGVAVLFINDNINTALPDSELRLTIMASLAQDEIRRLSERVKFGMNRSIKQGHILGHNHLYGYQKDKITGNLTIIESEAEIVKRLFNMYTIENISLNKIAKIFNNELSYQNKKWCPSTLSRMIKNPKYKGYYCGKKSEIIDYMTKKVKQLPKEEWVIYKDNKIPAIITEHLWEKANQKLNKKRKEKIMYQNRYPLSAKIYCQNDNEVFHRRKQCKTNDEITWICSKHLKNGKQSCNSSNLRQSEIYAILNDIISSSNLNIYNKVIDYLYNLYLENNHNQDITFHKEKYTKEINKIKIKKNKLLELNINNYLSNEEFSIQNNLCNIEIKKIKEKLSSLSNINIHNEKILPNLKKIINGTAIENIIPHILNKIVVSSYYNRHNVVKILIYLNISSKLIKNNTSEYNFQRGYNTKGTKRYKMQYLVKVFSCQK